MSETEEEINKPVREPKEPKSRAVFWTNIGILFSGLAAIALIVAIEMASLGLIATDKRFANMFNYVMSEFAQSKAAVQVTQKSMSDIQQTLQQNSDNIKNQTQAIADLQKLQRTNKDDFLVAEAFFLVKLANDHLQFENNTAVATKLLQSADQDVASLSDPRIYHVRETLAQDLQALQRAAQVDIPGIYARLAALSNEIDKLPVINTFINKATITNNTENLPWWRRGLNSMSQAFQHMIIIRNNQTNTPPFITPDQQAFLYQNLQAIIEKAQWGLLHHQQVVYQSSLQQAMSWIKKYIAEDSPMSKQMLANLQTLQQMNVQPSVPSVTNSLEALQSYMNK